MPKSKNRPAASSVSAVDKQMADIAAQIAALSARQEAAIKEMQRAAEEVAQQSKVHERLAQELARAEIEKNRWLHKNGNPEPLNKIIVEKPSTHRLFITIQHLVRASAEADRAVAQMAQADGYAGDAAACLEDQV
jgi:hypothetical protein